LTSDNKEQEKQESPEIKKMNGISQVAAAQYIAVLVALRDKRLRLKL